MHLYKSIRMWRFACEGLRNINVNSIESKVLCILFKKKNIIVEFCTITFIENRKHENKHWRKEKLNNN